MGRCAYGPAWGTEGSPEDREMLATAKKLLKQDICGRHPPHEKLEEQASLASDLAKVIERVENAKAACRGAVWGDARAS